MAKDSAEYIYIYIYIYMINVLFNKLVVFLYQPPKLMFKMLH